MINNVPDLTVEEYARSIHADLRQAGLLSKPLIIVCYSLGGLVTRSLIIDSMSKEEIANVKGVLFVACPLNGSD